MCSGNCCRKFPAHHLPVAAPSVTLGTDVVSADSWRGLLPLGPEMLCATGRACQRVVTCDRKWYWMSNVKWNLILPRLNKHTTTWWLTIIGVFGCYKLFITIKHFYKGESEKTIAVRMSLNDWNYITRLIMATNKSIAAPYIPQHDMT